MKKIAFWFRRDLRLEDNVGLHAALQSGIEVLPVFIFDSNILEELERDDARVGFIHDSLKSIHEKLAEHGSALHCEHGDPIEVWQRLISENDFAAIHTNRDYEPYAIQRDRDVEKLAKDNGVEWHAFKDQVIFEESEIVKDDGKPYTVFTPYKNKWRKAWKDLTVPKIGEVDFSRFIASDKEFPTLESLGFTASEIKVKPFDLSVVENYAATRNFPATAGTSNLSPHLRFGTVGIRQLISRLPDKDETFLNELIWREFFMQILFHFPNVVHDNFRAKYDGIQWRNNEDDFKRWCEGKTGYPMVDAGMRELNTTGYMHNRVRMVVASFLCKHLLIDWRWGEAYFASKLLDYELSSNNGNWQWAAGTGCDAAPYFRVFNPAEQMKKFDPKQEYVRRWVPELDTNDYVAPMVDHKVARERALTIYKAGIAAASSS